MTKNVLCYLLVFSAVLVVVTEGCACEFSRNRGCVIKLAAVAGKACKCIKGYHAYQGTVYYVCSAMEINCKNPDSNACKVPDKSFCSCMQAFLGDCWGYAAQSTCP